jgi:hypothetical protein
MVDKMPYTVLWRLELAAHLEPGPAADLLARVEARYADWGRVSSTVPGCAFCCTIAQDRLQ